MLPFEGEGCPAVIEAFHSFDGMEREHGMAILAVLAKPVVVGILVTIGAFAVGHIRKGRELFPVAYPRLMAFAALHFQVFALQGEGGPLVVEAWGRPEFRDIMAVFACL